MNARRCLARDPLAMILLIGGLALALAGLAIASFAAPRGWSLAMAGMLVEVSGPALHDRKHRAVGEAPHALWGANDRNKPSSPW